MLQSKQVIIMENSSLCKNCGFVNPPGMKFCGNCGTRLEVEAAKPPVMEALPERLGVMMGADLLERFRKAGLEASGQRRTVTILFADLTGFTPLSEKLEAENLYELLQQYIRMLAESVYKFEGMVDKLTGDGLMALFGAPIAQENSAEMASRAALDMHEGMKELNKKWNIMPGYELSIHVGLNVGTVIVGGIGSDYLMNYTAVGDSVNQARRLEENAKPGTTLVSEMVYKQAKELFEFQTLPPLLLKGKSEPVTAFTLIGTKAQPGSVRGIRGLRSPMVGREQEFQQARMMVKRLASKKLGGALLLTGEAGIGKSRLTRELKSIIEPDTIRVLEGHSLTYRRLIPYWIFQDILRNYLGVTSNSSKEIILNQLVQRANTILGNSSRRVLPYLEYVLGLESTETDTIRYLDAEQLRQQIFMAIRDLLVAEAKINPLLIILEDIHWADDSSLGLIQFILDSLRDAPLMIYMISRPSKGGWLSQMREQTRRSLSDRFLELELKTLRPDQSTQLLFSLLSNPEIPEELSARIVERAGGSPLFLEEILRVLIDKNIIYSHEGIWYIRPEVNLGEMGVPETLQDLILARFDRMGKDERRILQAASAIGYQFRFEILNEIIKVSLSEKNVRIVLKQLIEHDFVMELAGETEETYVFHHAIMSDSIYGTLLQKDRKELHGLIGIAIERLYVDRLDEQIELLAGHYYKSNFTEKALHYLILAGEKATRGYANEQARQHYEQALDLISKVWYTKEQYLKVHEGLGNVLVIIGEYQAARNHYQTVLEMITETLSSSEINENWLKEEAVLYRKVATTFERQGEYDKVLNCLYQAQQILGRLEIPLPGEQASILNDLGWIQFRRGNLDYAEKLLLQALPLVENTTEYMITASIYNRLGGINFQKDRPDLTAEYVLKSLRLREKIGDTAAVARTYNNLGLIQWKSGKWEEALKYFERSLDLQTDLGDVVALIELHTNLGQLQLDRGETHEAFLHLEKALKQSQLIGHSHHIASAYLSLTWYYVIVEDWREAVNYSRLSIDTFKEIGALDTLVELYTVMGMAYLGSGNLDAAEKWGIDAVNLFEQMGKGKDPKRIEDHALALRLLGDIARRRGDLEHAQQLLDQSLSVFQTLENTIEYSRTCLSLALLARENEQIKMAASLFSEARQNFARLGAMLDLHKVDVMEQE